MSEGIIQSDQPQDIEGEGKDLFSKFDDIIALREGLLSSGQEDPFNLVMEKVLSPTRAICNGRDTILLGTYNYMGMTFDPDVIAAGHKALDEFGTLEVGKLADILVLGADPIADISNIRKLEVLMKEGQIIDIESLPTNPVTGKW